MKTTTRIIQAAAALLQCLVMASTATHNVGGNVGWTLPPNSSLYTDWASSQTFAVGDNLVFTFAAGRHDAVEVPEWGYDSCSTANQIGSAITTSPATLTLTSAGDRFFFCGIPSHCSEGQKVTISVTSTAATPATTTAPPPSPSAASSGPAASPTGSVPGAAASLTSSIAAISAVLLSAASYFSSSKFVAT